MTQSNEVDRRVNLNTKAKSVSDLVLEDTDLASLSPKELEKWNEQKEERNVLISYIVAKAFKRTFESRTRRPPYGLLDIDSRHSQELRFPEEGFQPVQTLPNFLPTAMSPIANREMATFGRFKNAAIHMMHTLNYDLFQTIQETAALPDHEFHKKIYNRLQALLTPAWNSIDKTRTPLEEEDATFSFDAEDEMFNFIKRGVGTGVHVTRQVFQLSFELLMHQTTAIPTYKEIARVGLNSYPLLAYLSMGHLQKHIPALVEIESDGPSERKILDIEYFRLHTLPNGETHIEIDEEKWKKLLESKNLEAAAESVTTGCPAMAFGKSFEDQDVAIKEFANVVKGLLEFYADIIEAA